MDHHPPLLSRPRCRPGRLLRGADLVTAGLVGYLLGTWPSARLAGRWARRGVDPARDGTANPGALNTAHLLGPRWAAAVTIADVAKAWLATLVGRRLAGETGANVAGAAAVVGHCHPPVGPGGKGVAASFGQVLGTFPAFAPFDAVIAAAAGRLPWRRHRSRGAVTVSSLVWVAAAVVGWRRGWPSGRRSTPLGGAVVVASAVSSLVIARRFAVGAARVAVVEGADGEVRVA